MTKLDKLYNCNSYVFMEVVDTNKMQSECLIVPLSFSFHRALEARVLATLFIYKAIFTTMVSVDLYLFTF